MVVLTRRIGARFSPVSRPGLPVLRGGAARSAVRDGRTTAVPWGVSRRVSASNPVRQRSVLVPKHIKVGTYWLNFYCSVHVDSFWRKWFLVMTFCWIHFAYQYLKTWSNPTRPWLYMSRTHVFGVNQTKTPVYFFLIQPHVHDICVPATEAPRLFPTRPPLVAPVLVAWRGLPAEWLPAGRGTAVPAVPRLVVVEAAGRDVSSSAASSDVHPPRLPPVVLLYPALVRAAPTARVAVPRTTAEPALKNNRKYCF